MRLAVILLCAAIAGSMMPTAKAASGETAFAFSADPLSWVDSGRSRPV